MVKFPSRLVPAIITGSFRKNTPVSTCALANLITGKMGINRPEYGMFRQSITRCLDMMRGPDTKYDTGDVAALFKIHERFQSWMGISREEPKGNINISKEALYEKALLGWLKVKQAPDNEYSYSLMKALSRPCTDAEIARNFDLQGRRLKGLFSYEVFMTTVQKHGLRIGFAGSIAEGTFDAFSDIDLCWLTKDGSNVLPFRPTMMSNMGNAWSVDIWYGNIVSSWDKKMVDGPVIWLTKEELQAFASKPGYLREFYRNHYKV